MKLKRCAALLMLLCLLSNVALSPSAAAATSSDETEVRGVVERAFQQLRSGDYDGLYDVLPSTARQRISRQQFARQLQRSRDMYELDRVEIGAVRASGDIAMVDTTIYGRVRSPYEGEGKIVARQYLMREDGQWRVALDDRASAQRLLAANRDFARRYPPRSPRVFLKRDNRWVAIGSMDSLRRMTR